MKMVTFIVSDDEAWEIEEAYRDFKPTRIVIEPAKAFSNDIVIPVILDTIDEL